jgi:hypothetical protein
MLPLDIWVRRYPDENLHITPQTSAAFSKLQCNPHTLSNSENNPSNLRVASHPLGRRHVPVHRP